MKKTNIYCNNYILVIIAAVILIGILFYAMRRVHQKEMFAIIPKKSKKVKPLSAHSLKNMKKSVF